MKKLLNKAHDKDFEAIRKYFNKPDQIFLDIGANRGEATNSIFICSPSAHVLAFEPNKEIYQKFDKSFAKVKRDKLVSYNVGLSDEEGQFKLYIPFYKKFMYDGLASLHYKNAGDWLESRMWKFRQKHLNVREFEVNLKRLDDYNLNPYFIKIDVQGHELNVLKGGRSTLVNSKAILLIESPSQNVIEYLKDLGYEYFQYKNDKFFPRKKGKPNTFFIHPENENYERITAL